MKALRRWFGNETSDEESDNNLGEEEWNEVDRVKKKKKREEAKKKTERQTLSKGNQILGFGPIGFEFVEYNMEKGENFEQAKVSAIKEYLGHFLGYEEDELAKISIAETQMSGKGDDVIYGAFE